MKKLLLLLAVLCCSFSFANAQGIMQLEFSVEIYKPVGTGPGHPKSPELPPDAPNATLDGNVLTFTSSHEDYMLTLLDEDGEVAYQTSVPSSVSIVVLPTTLSGDFELQLDYGGDYYFYCDIAL